MVAQKYRWDFIGLSTDEKPTAATSPKVTDGSTFYCSDNSKLYVWYKDRWYQRKALGGGGGGGGGTATDVQINGSSITVSDTANIVTEGVYNASTNKIATMSDIPDTSNFITKSVDDLTNYTKTSDLVVNYQLKPTTQNIAGTSATITPVDNTIYQCGELTDITITNPTATGMYVIIFTSGSTPTTSTFPSSIIGIEQFSAEANTRYEINVKDGYALVGSWKVSA